ncbi:MAG TPA: exodeoxyribonuclease VII large subunit [Gammaproteobacteria bacterium]|nr:exodeoxyribonuclease VII large subunit [Gammaproteobacteria bacterium]
MPAAPANEAIWSVSALNFEIRTLLEQGVGRIWLEGEISNFAAPASGHWYFTLKDERAQLRAAMFRNRNGRVGFRPRNGQQVLIRAQVTLYEARGEFQLVVEHLEEAGIGRLMRDYEALKKRLSDEGLFDESRKKPVPAAALRIGIVTSPSGAAIRDALSVIRRRSPMSRVILYPVPVQGEQAAGPIARAIQVANQRRECDVLLLIRGGGSLEDLWCFNDEKLARVIADSKLPIVSGVGHEIDFTIADFAADLRAPTPSVAAETVTADQYELMSRIDRLQARLAQLQREQLKQNSQRISQLIQRLRAQHPERQLLSMRRQLRFAASSLVQAMKGRLQQQHSRQTLLRQRLHHQHPGRQIQYCRQRVEQWIHRQDQQIHRLLEHKRQQLQLQARSLDDLSPLKTLGRGFAAIEKQGRLVHSAQDLETGDSVSLRFSDGQRRARIDD